MEWINFKSGKFSAAMKIFFLLLALGLSNSSASQTFSWSAIQVEMNSYGGYEDLFFINSNTGWLIHIYGMIYKTTNGGYNWTLTDSVGIGGFTDVKFVNETTGWISSNSKNLFKTINGGADLVRITNFPDPVPSGLNSIHLLNDLFLYGCGYEQANAMFVKSSNGGNTWETRSLLQYATGLTDCYMFDENTGLAGGRIIISAVRYSIILRTTNGGNSWTVVYQGNRNTESVQKFCFVNALTGYASLERITSPEKYALKTTNAGLNWTELPFPDYHEHGIGFINENTGWIGGDFNPTFGTTDGGQSWFNANIGEFLFGFQFFGDTLGYACGEKIYMYSRTSNINMISSEIPEKFELLQNYPNPFNPVTTIGYAIRNAGKVQLRLYDITGREIASLIDQYHTPGTYRYTFNAAYISSGVYYYALSANNFRDVKMLVVIK